jgi:hypothetical protein
MSIHHEVTSCRHIRTRFEGLFSRTLLLGTLADKETDYKRYQVGNEHKYLRAIEACFTFEVIAHTDARVVRGGWRTYEHLPITEFRLLVDAASVMWLFSTTPPTGSVGDPACRRAPQLAYIPRQGVYSEQALDRK